MRVMMMMTIVMILKIVMKVMVMTIKMTGAGGCDLSSVWLLVLLSSSHQETGPVSPLPASRGWQLRKLWRVGSRTDSVLLQW